MKTTRWLLLLIACGGGGCISPDGIKGIALLPPGEKAAPAEEAEARRAPAPVTPEQVTRANARLKKDALWEELDWEDQKDVSARKP